MPLYSRHCEKCDELFDVQCKIAEKDELKPECPFCGSVEGAWMVSAPSVSMRGERFMTHKKDAGFQEVISKIAERNPRTAICERT